MHVSIETSFSKLNQLVIAREPMITTITCMMNFLTFEFEYVMIVMIDIMI